MLDDPVDVFGEYLVESTSACVKRYAPWASDMLAAAWLAEYAISDLIDAPFAPNPFISQPLSLHALRGQATGEDILSYVEDLRCETSKAMNLHKGFNIYDVQVPAVFGAVLRESTEPGDLVKVASQMNAEARAFRSWCRSLDSMEAKDPKRYLDRLNAAKDSLRKLGKSLALDDVQRMQVCVSTGVGVGISLPSSTLKKLVDYLDVDVRFFRPRAFLLNLLSSARQVRRLSSELGRVFALKDEYAEEATVHLLKMADEQQTLLKSQELLRLASKRLQPTTNP